MFCFLTMSGKEEITYTRAPPCSAAGQSWWATGCANTRNVPNRINQLWFLPQLHFGCDLPIQYSDFPAQAHSFLRWTPPLLCAAFVRIQTTCSRHYALYLKIGYNYTNHLRDTTLFKEAFFTKSDTEPPSNLRLYLLHLVISKLTSLKTSHKTKAQLHICCFVYLFLIFTTVFTTTGIFKDYSKNNFFMLNTESGHFFPLDSEN